MEEYIKQIQWKIAFNGRISRKPFWINAIFINILTFVVMIIPIINLLAPLYISIWMISLAIRRVHDIGKPGWWCIVPIVNLIYYCRAGQPEENQWGPNPKELDIAPAAAPPTMQIPTPNQPSAMCLTCEGKGVNAAGYTCPACGGTGVAKQAEA